ncbi:MAG: preprotein translocase subunit SecE [Candidatus Sumerlaeota bacterium]|nr:preprotein translocase subunit SecE [Candidatus Sumerlaeota bacterium]
MHWFLLGMLVVLVALGYVYRAKVKELWGKAEVFYREIKTEMRKVAWPSRDEVIGNTIIVLITVVILAVVIGSVDAVLARFAQWLFVSGAAGQ